MVRANSVNTSESCCSLGTFLPRLIQKPRGLGGLNSAKCDITVPDQLTTPGVCFSWLPATGRLGANFPLGRQPRSPERPQQDVLASCHLAVLGDKQGMILGLIAYPEDLLNPLPGRRQFILHTIAPAHMALRSVGRSRCRLQGSPPGSPAVGRPRGRSAGGIRRPGWSDRGGPRVSRGSPRFSSGWPSTQSAYLRVGTLALSDDRHN